MSFVLFRGDPSSTAAGSSTSIVDRSRRHRPGVAEVENAPGRAMGALEVAQRLTALRPRAMAAPAPRTLGALISGRRRRRGPSLVRKYGGIRNGSGLHR